MATFPRTVLPITVSALFSPGALKERGHSGLMQIRTTKQIGWSWTETWGLLNVVNVNDVGLLTFVQKAWNRGEINEMTHPLTPGSGRSPNGLGTSGVLVAGASQVGETLITDQWPINTLNCVRAGDVIRIAGDNAVYLVTADADSNGTGQVSIPLNPPLRLSPGDNAAVTTAGVTFRATIISRSRFEGSESPTYYAGLSLVFSEALI